jgi:hypothetical protein
VPGDQPVFVNDPHLGHRADHRHGPVRICRRHRIGIGVEPDQRERIGRHVGRPTGLERPGWQRQHRRPVLGEERRHRPRLPAHGSLLVLPAPLDQLIVQLVQRIDRRHRDQEVRPGIVQKPLDVTLLVRPTDETEVTGEQVVTLQPQELVGQLPLPRAHDPRHRRLAVVVRDPRWHPAEEGERSGVPLLKRLGALPRECLNGDRVGIGPTHHEHGDLNRHAREDHLCEPVVNLRLPGRMGQRQEHFLPPDLQLPDRVLDRRVPARKPVLLAEPLPDPLRRVTLLLRGLRVVVQDLPDDR